MEEAVTRKFIHQDSSSVTSLCGESSNRFLNRFPTKPVRHLQNNNNNINVGFVASVECCLSHGLRRRALGLFRTSSTTALLHKVAKSFAAADVVSKLVLQAEAEDGVK